MARWRQSAEFDALYIRMGAEVTTHEEEVLKWTQ